MISSRLKKILYDAYIQTQSNPVEWLKLRRSFSVVIAIHVQINSTNFKYKQLKHTFKP